VEVVLFASIVHTIIDMDRLEEAVGGIGAVKQRLAGMPGFRQALWFQPIDGAGLMVSVWDDEAAATSATPPVGFSPAQGVTIESVEFRAIIDSA
jgi:hypothetical protein